MRNRMPLEALWYRSTGFRVTSPRPEPANPQTLPRVLPTPANALDAGGVGPNG